MRYREVTPPAPLAPLVRCLWILEDDRGPGEIDRVLPDGCVEIIIHYGAAMKDQPGAIVAGQLKTAARLESTGPIGMIGVRFEPWGAGCFLRESLRGLTGSVVPLDTIWGAESERVEARVRDAKDDAARLRVLTESLMRRLPRGGNRSSELAAAFAWITQSQGAIPIEELATRLGWSRRRLERRFAEAVGLPPKSLCRIERFQSVVKNLREPESARLVDLAIDAGFADQAHLANEFRALAGVSIRRWLAEQHEFSDCFIVGLNEVNEVDEVKED